MCCSHHRRESRTSRCFSFSLPCGVTSIFLFRFFRLGKTVQNRPYFFFHPGLAQPLGSYDTGQARRSFLDIPVDQNKIVLRVVPNLFSRSPQTALNHFFAVFGARAEALLENIPGWRKHKNTNSFRDRYLQLSRTLDVNVEYQVLAQVDCRLEGL